MHTLEGNKEGESTPQWGVVTLQSLLFHFSVQLEFGAYMYMRPACLSSPSD